MKLIFVMLFFVFWVQSSGAVTLEEAFQAAAEKNELIHEANESVIQSEEQLTQSKSTIFPNLSFNATYQLQPEPKDAAARQFFEEEQTTAYFNLKQPLFRGFREYAGIRHRTKSLNSEKQKRISSLLNLYQSVAQSYLNVLALEQDLKNLAEQKRIYGDRVKDLLARTKRGESNSTEALTAQSTEAALDAEMKIVESKLVSARENFQLITTLPSNSTLTDMSEKKVELPHLKPLADYISRIDNRPDIVSAREQEEAAEEEVKIAKGGHWPDLDLVGNYYVQRSQGYLSDLKWDVSLQLTFPLFEGGMVMSQTREAASRRRVKTLELSQLRRQAEADIRSLHEGLRNRASQLEALQRSSELSEKNYLVLQRDSRRGLSRSIDVQIALTEFRVARRTYDQARFEARLDWIRLQIASAQFPAVVEKEL